MKASGGFYNLWRLFHFLENAKVLFNAGDTNGACDRLMAAYRKCDGQSPPPDFVEDPSAEQLGVMIEDFLTYLTDNDG